MRQILYGLILLTVLVPAFAANGDELTIQQDQQLITLKGDILIEDQAGTVFFQSTDGKLWFVESGQIKHKVDDDEPATPDSNKVIGEKVLKELPAGFKIYDTKHYVIAYQTELVYAKWVAGLYEARLYRAFESFWKRKKRCPLTEPKFPLVIVVFGNKAEYQAYTEKELGPGQDMIAYYNLQNNRVTMYDLTTANRPPNQAFNERRIEQILQTPAAINMVATMIHEATHQLIFNRGLQTRFADTPLWLNEGLAMYFEAPNLRNKRGWQQPGLIFRQRLVRFRNYLQARPANSLETLISNNDRLQSPDSVLDAYAESWALNHFLLNRKSKEFVAYLKHMSSKQALEEDDDATRLKEFTEHFGDLKKLDQEFIKYVLSLR